MESSLSSASHTMATKDVERPDPCERRSRMASQRGIAAMEQVHGVDVSWMTKGSPRDKLARSTSAPTKTPAPSAAQAEATPTTEATSPTKSPTQANGQSLPSSPNGSATPKRISPRPSALTSISPRRNSWFSNISAKFSSSNSSSSSSPPHHHGLPHLHHHKDQQQHGAQADEAQPCQPIDQPTSPLAGAGFEPSPPRLHSSKNAVLQHAAKSEGNGPYTPAPPKSGPGLLGVLRRLSSSGVSPSSKLNHGLVERRTLNVDHERQRCPISELKDAKLRRVSFCVDVEIAPMPKYATVEGESKLEKLTTKKKATDKGEEQTQSRGKPQEEQASKDVSTNGSAAGDDSGSVQEEAARSTKKKEKKKKSEEERKSRKEKRRRLAEDNGTVPIEIYYDSSDSSDERRSSVKSFTTTTTTATTATSTSHPTTNPIRIYRRCCQLRETPILKRVTEQLASSATTGVVDKLDLTDYWLQLPDFVTLGDWLAVVPVREVVLANSGLTDEALRVVLAGLLAAKPATAWRRKKPRHETEEQGGVVERVVLKNNKLGPDGWKHLSLFLYMSRSLKDLDLSHIPFPKQAPATTAHNELANGQQIPRSIADVFAAALAERPAGSTLEMINMGETEPSMEQLGVIVDGVIKCGIRRLGLAHNHLDERGIGLVARYLASGKCKGLDLGGNDLGRHLETLTAALGHQSPLWALSLAGCNLDCAALGKMLPQLTELEELRFIDLSHNHDLFQSTPSAVGLLRSYLPKMKCLKRIHLQDVELTAPQAIAIIEVLPEVPNLAHIDLLGNTELVKLAKAQTAEAQEEACALYASLLATTRVSKSLICVDIEVPFPESGEIVKAMAKQVVAYCLRNMERIPDTNIAAATAVTEAMTEAQAQSGAKTPPYPDVLAHLVGHDVLEESQAGDQDLDSAPDDDYVIGGTGVVKALTCCLENRSRGQEPAALSDVTEGVAVMAAGAAHHLDAGDGSSLAAGGKAKDMSKHLLAGARKIRIRLQPALIKAQANPGDEQNLRRLQFLDETLQGIIKRFEDEFPDTRVGDGDEEVMLMHAGAGVGDAGAGAGDGGSSSSSKAADDDEASQHSGTADSSARPCSAVAISDGEDEAEIGGTKPLSRTNSMLSRVQAEEEGRMLREGHRFRAGILRREQGGDNGDVAAGGSGNGGEVGSCAAGEGEGTASGGEAGEVDAQHAHLLESMAEDIGGALLAKVREKGAQRALREDGEFLRRCIRDSDPDHWDRFVESQQKARANIKVPSGRQESAIAD